MSICQTCDGRLQVYIIGSSAAVDNAAASRVKVSIKRIAVAVGRRNRRPLREVKVVKDKPKRGMQQLLQRIVPRVRWCAQRCSARAFLDYPLPVTLPQRSLNEQRDERSSPCHMHTFGPWFMILVDDFVFKCRYFLYIFLGMKDWDRKSPTNFDLKIYCSLLSHEV